MTTAIRWPTSEGLLFLGRNGYGRCTGLEIVPNEGLVDLRPFTSRDRPGRCLMQAPLAAIPQIVKILSGISQVPMRKWTGAWKEKTESKSKDRLETMLCDWEDAGRQQIGITIAAQSKVIEIFCEGYRTAAAASGHGAPILLEVHRGRLRLLVWGDIDSEDPTHVIDLEGARSDEEPCSLE
jgi:hypothetical protein